MSGGHDDDDELHEEHEEHGNHEAWVIPYADLLTLLMAMFIALFAISSVNVDKAKRLEQGFNNAASTPLAGIFSGGASKTAVQGAVNGSSASSGGHGILGAGGDSNTTATTAPSGSIGASSAIQAAEKKEQQSFAHDQQQLQQAANASGVGNEISFQLEGRGLVVRLVNDNVLFASGQAVIEPEGTRVLQVIGAVLCEDREPAADRGLHRRPTDQHQSVRVELGAVDDASRRGVALPRRRRGPRRVTHDRAGLRLA